MSQTLVLSIKHATVNSIPYFGVSAVIMLSHIFSAGGGSWTLNSRMQAASLF